MQHTIKNILGLLISILLILSGTAISGQISTQVRGDRLDADLDKAPLRAVLADISQKTGIQVFLEQGLSGRVTAKFSNLTLEEGLKRILADYSNSMIFSKMEKGPAKGEIVLSEIKVFQKGTRAGNSKFEALGAVTASVPGNGRYPGNTGSPAQGDDSIAGSDPAAAGAAGSAYPGKPQSQVATALIKRDNNQIAKLRREIYELRRNMQDTDDDRETAKIRADIARKTAELQKRQTWMQARNYGMSRIERQQSGM